jgi:DNA polymerase-4
LRAIGIADGAALQAATPELLAGLLGRFGWFLHAIAHGRDERSVRPDRPRKSLGVEETLSSDLTDPAAMWVVLETLGAELARRAERAGFPGRTLTLKVKFSDFTIRTRRVTSAAPLAGEGAILAATRTLLYHPQPPARPVRLLGLTLANVDAGLARQLSLLDFA